MAARAGAEHVVGCEMFGAMAAVAKEVTSRNCKSKVSVVPKKSSDLIVGDDGDMRGKADLLVTEIFDSALLGEGVLPSVRHAFRSLLKPGAEIIPFGAKVFAQLVQCEAIIDFYRSPG